MKESPRCSETLLTLEAPSDFAVVDRIGTGHNCDVYQFPETFKIEGNLF